MGFFISYNSGSSALRLNIVNAILDRYYPVEAPVLSAAEAAVPTPMAGYQERASRFSGSYRPLQADTTTFGKLMYFFSQQVEIAALLIVSMIILAFMIWPVGLLLNKLRGQMTTIVWPEVMARLWAAFVGGMLALFIFRAIGVLYAIDSIGGLPNFVWGISDEMVAALNAITLPTLMALTLPVLAMLAWVKGWWKLGGRIHYTLVMFAVLALVWWAWYWNLLGFQG